MKNKKLLRAAIAVAMGIIGFFAGLAIETTGLFYILCALGIAFVVWGYAREDKLIAFEDKVFDFIRKLFHIERFEREIHAINRENKKRRALDTTRVHGTMKNEQYHYNNSSRKSQIKERIR